MRDILRTPRDRRKVREVPPNQISRMKAFGWLGRSVFKRWRRPI
jgi:hypothetical protein